MSHPEPLEEIQHIRSLMYTTARSRPLCGEGLILWGVLIPVGVLTAQRIWDAAVSVPSLKLFAWVLTLSFWALLIAAGWLGLAAWTRRKAVEGGAVTTWVHRQVDRTALAIIGLGFVLMLVLSHAGVAQYALPMWLLVLGLCYLLNGLFGRREMAGYGVLLMLSGILFGFFLLEYAYWSFLLLLGPGNILLGIWIMRAD